MMGCSRPSVCLCASVFDFVSKARGSARLGIDKSRTMCYTVDVTSGLPTALTAERRSAISQVVTVGGVARVADLAAQFRVNVATIRRDLQDLEQRGEVQRVRGGAVAVGRDASARADAQALTKESRIGQAVVDTIADGETVFLGPGELPLAAARALGKRSRITVVTSSLEAAHWVAKNTEHALIITGGQVERRDLGMVGRLTRAALASLRADHVILELGVVSPVEGLTDDSLSQAEIAQMLLETGARVTILVLEERVGRVAAAYIAPASEADVIVTSREVPSSVLWDLSELGVQIVLA